MQQCEPAFEQQRNRGCAIDLRPSRNVGGNTRLAAGLDALADRNMAAHADLPGQHDVIFELRAARDPGLRTQKAVPANRDVVADLDEIIDLRPLTHDSPAESRAI